MLTASDGLVSHLPDTASYVPPDLVMFAELFRKKIGKWEITDEADLIPLGPGWWVPDYRLTHRDSGESVYLEVLGFCAAEQSKRTWADCGNTPARRFCWRSPRH